MNVLVAEDDAVTRRLLEVTLQSWGHEVTMACDGQEACDLYTRVRPSLALLDWQMPVLDGLDVCRHIRASPLGAETFILVVTARDAPADLAAALEAGADDYMMKPVTPGDLHARLTVAAVRIAQRVQRAADQITLARARWLAGIGETALTLQHEINNPLAALMGMAELLTLPGNSAAEHAEYLQGIRVQSQRIADVVKRISFLRRGDSVEYVGGTTMIDIWPDRRDETPDSPPTRERSEE